MPCYQFIETAAVPAQLLIDERNELDCEANATGASLT